MRSDRWTERLPETEDWYGEEHELLIRICGLKHCHRECDLRRGTGRARGLNCVGALLAIWASDDPAWKADRLLRLIAHPTWLQEAARQALASRGSKTAGVDGVTKSTLLPELDAQLELLRTELLAGTYTPTPARRIYIQKANGKFRPLDIPTLKDRIVQRAMLMAMEPLWESDFHPTSYGFRPERSVHHAIRAVKLQLTYNTDTRGRWVIEGDLASYFDRAFGPA